MTREELPPEIRNLLMDEKRMAEIAILVLKHEYRLQGDTMFIATLKVAMLSLGITDEEMQKFYKSIVFDVTMEESEAQTAKPV